jgi:DNA invertase Pin-like site-specific DNA recombinase
MLIGYARVSTQDQNPELQLDALTAAGCEQLYTDTISGATKQRPQLDELRSYIRKGDTLVVWRLDRLGRSLKDLIEWVEWMDENGISFKSITESIDTSTSGGKLIFSIFGAIAEFERNLIRKPDLPPPGPVADWVDDQRSWTTKKLNSPKNSTPPKNTPS